MLSVKYALKLEFDVKCAMTFWTSCHFHWYIQYQILFKVILSAFFLWIFMCTVPLSSYNFTSVFLTHPVKYTKKNERRTVLREVGGM